MSLRGLDRPYYLSIVVITLARSVSRRVYNHTRNPAKEMVAHIPLGYPTGHTTHIHTCKVFLEMRVIRVTSRGMRRACCALDCYGLKNHDTRAVSTCIVLFSQDGGFFISSHSYDPCLIWFRLCPASQTVPRHSPFKERNPSKVSESGPSGRHRSY